MSLSANDLSELMELWAELNLTAAENVSGFETLRCSGGVGRLALLHVLSVLYIFIFLVGLVANGLVVWVHLRSERMRDETHRYAAHLAAADLCVVATLPVWVASLLQGGRWPFGDAACKLTHLVFSANLFGSIFFLTCMSVDRYLSVTLLADGRRKKAARRLICVAVWALALAASVPDTYFLRVVKSSHHDGAVCRPVYPPASPRVWMAAVQLSFFLLGFAVPFPVITASYLLLAAAVPPDAGRRLVLSYILVFLACWLPFHGVLLLDSLTLLGVLPFGCRLDDFLDAALHLTQAVSLLHCCINPVLYNFLSRNYRHDLMKAVLRSSSRTSWLLDASDTESSAGDDRVPLEDVRVPMEDTLF
ncbi:atypical chemokine receptor 3-like [Brachyistius frenatus]|uniref:atypical chemokine receptor 3-like n=1 Tax=Brachyistius frenatus TaxID=100188 RepID=UPI0037E8251E